WVQTGAPVSHQGYTVTAVAFGRRGKGDRLPGVLFQRKMPEHRGITIVANLQGIEPYVGPNLTAQGLADELLRVEESVLVLDLFMTGSLYDPMLAEKRDPFALHFTAYNRTDLQERIQDLATAAVVCRRFAPRVALCGANGAGALAMLAAPLVDAVVADADGVDSTIDDVLMRPDMFSPGLRNFGVFQGAAGLAAPNPLLIHHTGNAFPVIWLEGVYSHQKPAGRLEVSVAPFSDIEIARWVGGVKK
ncbi:MAG TPA: hypothetical protein VK968_18700, partial [Roseimicrobium sp.]|nr:hypothetical protein [Roseimicrobium sp.]